MYNVVVWKFKTIFWQDQSDWWFVKYLKSHSSACEQTRSKSDYGVNRKYTCDFILLKIFVHWSSYTCITSNILAYKQSIKMMWYLWKQFVLKLKTFCHFHSCLCIFHLFIHLKCTYYFWSLLCCSLDFLIVNWL